MLTNKDILKHYLASLLVYGIILIGIIICPFLNEIVRHPIINVAVFFIVCYLLYAIFAYPILLKTRPAYILNSRSITVVNYLKDFFKSGRINLSEEEKQAFTIIFIKTFFSSSCLAILFSQYFPSLIYDGKFMIKMGQVLGNSFLSGNFFTGLLQYVEDTADMFLIIITMITLIVYSISYLTESEILKNKIKAADTSFLGIVSCICCYYPFLIVTGKFIPTLNQELIRVDNYVFKFVIVELLIIANLISLISVISLGGKSGNLTNRGIIMHFPYNIIRHPNYFMEIVKIILYTIPVYFISEIPISGKIFLTLGMFLWFVVYLIRTFCEERFLLQDDEYVKYCEKVKYRYIPKIF